jgi:hypothetical protein
MHVDGRNQPLDRFSRYIWGDFAVKIFAGPAHFERIHSRFGSHSSIGTRFYGTKGSRGTSQDQETLDECNQSG